MSVLGFWNHMVSVTTTRFHQCLSEAAIDDAGMSDRGHVPVKPGSIRKYTSRPYVPTLLRNQEELDLNLRFFYETGQTAILSALSFLVYENGTEMAVTGGVLDTCMRQCVCNSRVWGWRVNGAGEGLASGFCFLPI